MHVRFTTAVGLPVFDDDASEVVGMLSGIFLHPDTGKVEGFFVRTQTNFGKQQLFLSSLDIRRWGLRVVIRSADMLSPLEDRVRLRTLLDERRFILDQRILTDTGRYLGTCRDVQFDTDLFMVEWIWPKKWWRWGMPIALSQILEVRRDAIIVRDPSAPAPEKATPVPNPLLNRLPDAA